MLSLPKCLEVKQSVNPYPPCLHLIQWRHNERNDIANHQPHDCLLNCLFRRRSKKTSKLRVTGLCEGNSPVTGEFPAQKCQQRGKCLHFDGVIMHWHLYSTATVSHAILRNMYKNITGINYQLLPSPNRSRAKQQRVHISGNMLRMTCMKHNCWFTSFRTIWINTDLGVIQWLGTIHGDLIGNGNEPSHIR